MSEIRDNWVRLVVAVLKKQRIWELCHAPSFSSSSHRSQASDLSFLDDIWFDFEVTCIQSKLVLISDFNPAFNIQDLPLASTSLLGKGTFGGVYTAASVNDSEKIVVRRLNSTYLSEDVFKHWMDIVGKLRHESIVPLRAYYWANGERLMLYDYYSHGSLFALLHGHNKPSLNWYSRLKIAICAARGIDAIHAHKRAKLVHGNIKSSNILVSSELSGFVADFGLAKMIPTSFMSTSRCYAPEIDGNSQNATQESDVYSFGILLLELLTRKCPVHVPGGPKVVDLVKLVHSVRSRLSVSYVFDSDLLQYPSIREDMIKVLQIAISCVSKSPDKRPIMSRILMMLTDLDKGDSCLISSEESLAGDGSFLFQRCLSMEECLSNDSGILLRMPELSVQESPTGDSSSLISSIQFLGQGNFGTCYIATLNDGRTFVVKQLSSLIQRPSFEDFIQLMNAIGRCNHKNVRKLRACSYDRFTLLYDYQEDTLENLLHDVRRGASRYFGWLTRLRIALDAARGLAHIHAQDGGTFVHGNVNLSNILIDTQGDALISDPGLAKLVTPIRRAYLGNSKFLPPESTHIRNASQSSDVYSFGVVLRMLHSGGIIYRRLLDPRHDEKSVSKFMQLAEDCCAYSPNERPMMPEVASKLEMLWNESSHQLSIK